MFGRQFYATVEALSQMEVVSRLLARGHWVQRVVPGKVDLQPSQEEARDPREATRGLIMSIIEDAIRRKATAVAAIKPTADYPVRIWCWSERRGAVRPRELDRCYADRAGLPEYVWPLMRRELLTMAGLELDSETNLENVALMEPFYICVRRHWYSLTAVLTEHVVHMDISRCDRARHLARIRPRSSD